MMRRLIYIALVGCLLMAANIIADDDGGTESVFNIGAGARAMAMGNAHVAMAEDATTLYYNPGAMSYLSSQEMSFLHTILFQSTVYDFISYVYPYSDRAAFGIAGMRLGTDDIGKRDEFTDVGQFSASNLQLLLSYGRRFSERWSGGMNLKLAHQSIDNLSAYGYGLDLAGHYRITDDFAAGLMLQDIIGARLRLITEKERTPFTLRTGLAYKYRPATLPLVGTATFDLEKPEHRSLKLRTGIEILHRTGLSVRGGYDRDNITLGLGIRYQQFDVDYAYKFIDHLSDSHRFSLIFRFGLTRAERRAKIAQTEQFDRTNYIEADRKASLKYEMDRAQEFYDARNLDSALAAFYRADAFADAETRKTIDTHINSILQLMSGQRGIDMIDSTQLTPPAHAAAAVAQAQEFMNSGDLKAAREVVNAALNQNIDSPELQALKSVIETRIGDFIRSNNLRAQTAFDQGNYIEAYSRYNRVLTVDDANLSAQDGARAAKLQIDLAQHIKLALDYFDQSRYVLSEQEFKAVLQLDPNNETARRHLQQIDAKLTESGTQEEMNLRQDSVMWQKYSDGVEAYRAGDYKKAIELWEEILKKYPNDKMTRENIRQASLRVKE